MQPQVLPAYTSFKLHTRAREIADFNRKRRHNALRLKNRFADIIERYGHDFEDVGDVIDLETEEVVVDNGHLRDMEGELDPAYELCDSEDEGEGEGEGVVVDEDGDEMDELGVDMLTEGEIRELRGLNVPGTEEEEDETMDGEEQIHSTEQDENVDTALITLPTADLCSIGEPRKFEAPMFPQLEMAVNTMTSMLQRQMMAMLGQVLPGQKAPQPMPESRQIPPAPAPQTSLKRRYDDIANGRRIYTQSPEPRTSSPQSQALKRRRISDAHEQEEDQSSGASRRDSRSSPILKKGLGTSHAQMQEALFGKLPKSMSERPQRSMRLRPPRTRSGTIAERKSSPAKLLTKISQFLPDEDTSEDELSFHVSPRGVKATTPEAPPEGASSPKLSTPTADVRKAATPRAISPRASTPEISSSKDRHLEPSAVRDNTPTAAAPKDIASEASSLEANTRSVSSPTAGISSANMSEPRTPKASPPAAASSLNITGPETSLSLSHVSECRSPIPPRKPSPRVVIIRKYVAVSEVWETDEASDPDLVTRSASSEHKRRRRSIALLSEQQNKMNSRIPTPFDKTTVDSSVELLQPLDSNGNMLADDEESRLPKQDSSEAMSDPAPKNAKKRPRRTTLSRLLAEAEQYTAMWHPEEKNATCHGQREGRPRRDSPMTNKPEAVMTTRRMKSRSSGGGQRYSDSQSMSADSYATKSEDEPGENGEPSTEPATDGPMTVVNVTTLKASPAPHEAHGTLQRSTALRTRRTSSARRRTIKAVIPDSEEEIEQSQEAEM
ncbi:hypothetical protein FKW77_010889 [Venturia effusa]|uniref:Uncharacterized protein n=1 Tax=Venturia effusa TaxID=50376 RepID=A0A517KYQ9_9PEZI|nr:hypothetical protein FKW77_010889 [Venturia effusa]